MNPPYICFIMDQQFLFPFSKLTKMGRNKYIAMIYFYEFPVFSASLISKLWSILIVAWLGFFVYGTCVWGQPTNFTFDFESGDLRGWEKAGNAFDHQPTLGDNPTARHRGQPSHHQGKYWIGTYEKYQGRQGQRPGDIQGDRPHGTLTSSSFTIPKGSLSFLIGGGSSFKTRVELIVQDPIEGNIRVLYASGGNMETMHRVNWDLSPYARKIGRIRIVDESSGGWGHINVDDFRFSSFELPTFPAFPVFPEDERVKVPNLVGKKLSEEVERIIIERRLRMGRIHEDSSNREAGTIIRQHPLAGSMVLVETPINLWVASRGETPPAIEYKARIRSDRDKIVEGHGVRFIAFLSPEDQGVEYQFMFGDGVKSDWLRNKRTVHRYSTPGLYRVFVHVRKRETIIAESEPIEIQVVPQIVYGVTLRADKDNPFPGESVQFFGDLQPERDGAEYWFDFGDGSNSGWTISNETEHTYERPGRYRVIMEAKAGVERIGTSNPLFIEVKERPLEVLPQKENQYQLYLEVEPEQVEPRQNVIFSATLEPYSEDVEYRFVFGDGNVRDWSGNTNAEHLYEEAGSYHAYVLVRINGRGLWESNEVLVTVFKEAPPGIPKWVWIIPGLFILLGGSYLLSRIKKSAGKKGEVVLSISPHMDSGDQEMESETRLKPSLEVRLRPVTDQGKQEIESEKPLLMSDERREDGE